MFEFAKKGFFIGLGLASMTKDKAEAFAKEFAKAAKMSEEEGHKFADYIQQESKKAQDNLKETINAAVEKASSKLASKSRLESLEARVAKLEAELCACDCTCDGSKNADAPEQQPEANTDNEEK